MYEMPSILSKEMATVQQGFRMPKSHPKIFRFVTNKDCVEIER